VAAFTRYLRDLLESDANLQDVWVAGEVSNLSRPQSGHLYFTLKDSKAALRCVMWRGQATRLRFVPREGDAIEVHGKVGVYETSGTYQLYADTIRQTGEGALYQEFLRLKARLEAEGLFDPARKRPLPAWPHRIGIVTSPTGAALQDMLNTIRRRFPLAEVVLASTPVQGDEAPPRIIQALHALNQLAHPDVILVARGGGSIEDLWAFNDEYVARAIAMSAAPVITGVGHETDFTLADFAADHRAPTPTAAAEVATPDQDDLRQTLQGLAQALSQTILIRLSDHRWALKDLQLRLNQYSPRQRIQNDLQRLDDHMRRAHTALAHRLQMQRLRLAGLGQQLGALNPQTTLRRGFALVRKADGTLVRRVGQVAEGEMLSVQMVDGLLRVRVNERVPEKEIQNA